MWYIMPQMTRQKETERERWRIIIKKKINKTRSNANDTTCMCVFVHIQYIHMRRFLVWPMHTHSLTYFLRCALHTRIQTQKDKSLSLILNEIMVHINYFVHRVKWVSMFVYRFISFHFLFCSLLCCCCFVVCFFLCFVFIYHHLLQLSFSVCLEYPRFLFSYICVCVCVCAILEALLFIARGYI